MTYFITSDTHFGHARILTLGNGRPFDTIEEHDETLVENWNAVVGESDTVIHLGDVVFGRREETLPILDRLNGYKILIPGNHDHVSTLNKKRDKWLPIYGEFFDEIWDEQVRLGDTVLSHYPPAEIGDHDEHDRYPHMRPALGNKVTLYFHGHTHQDYVMTNLSNGAVAMNMGVDANLWTPVEIEDESLLGLTSS